MWRGHRPDQRVDNSPMPPIGQIAFQLKMNSDQRSDASIVYGAILIDKCDRKIVFSLKEW